MGIVDILFIGILVLGFISGLQKGLITSFLACIAMAVASFLASGLRTSLVNALMDSDFRIWLQNSLSDQIEGIVTKFSNLLQIDINGIDSLTVKFLEKIFNIGSYVLMFALVFFAIMLVVNLINNVFRMPKLRVFDGFLGGLLGILRAYCIICLIVAALPVIIAPIDTEIVDTLLKESALGRFFTNSESALSDLFGIGAKVLGL